MQKWPHKQEKSLAEGKLQKLVDPNGLPDYKHYLFYVNVWIIKLVETQIEVLRL